MDKYKTGTPIYNTLLNSLYFGRKGNKRKSGQALRKRLERIVEPKPLDPPTGKLFWFDPV